MKIIKSNKLTEGAGHNPRAWLVSLQDMYGDDMDELVIAGDLDYTLGEIDLKSLGFTDNIDGAKEQVIPHESRLAEFKLELGYYGDELEMEVKSGDIGDFIDKMISEKDEKMLEVFKSLPSAKSAIEDEKEKFKEKYDEDLDDFEAVDAINFVTNNGEKLEKEFEKFTETEVAKLRSEVQTQLKKVFGDKLRIATGAWTSSQVENKTLKEEEDKITNNIYLDTDRLVNLGLKEIKKQTGVNLELVEVRGFDSEVTVQGTSEQYKKFTDYLENSSIADVENIDAIKMDESLQLKLEVKDNEEVSKIITKIADLEAELDIISNDKEVDQKDIKSIKDKIYRLNKKLNEGKENTNADEENLEKIKIHLQASGIKNPRTLDLMSKDVLKLLKTSYDKNTSRDGIYYDVTITDAIAKKIEQITGRKPNLTIGKSESKLNEESDKDYIIEISYKNSRNKKLTTTSYLKKMLDMKDAEVPGKQPYIAVANKEDALKMDRKTVEKNMELLTKSYPDYNIQSIKLGIGNKEEARKEQNKLLFANKELTEAVSVNEVIKELPVYLRINDGTSHYVQVQEDDGMAQRPEEYDQGYVTGWERGKDPKFDEEQDEKFKEATEAFEDGEVYLVRNIKDDTIDLFLYGNKELDAWLKDVNAEEVNIEDLMK